MFSNRLNRVAQRAATTTAPTLPSTSTAVTYRTTQCFATRPSHQRRPSSSKASCPPDSSKPAPAAKAAATANTEEAAPTPTSAPQHRPAPRKAKKARSFSRVQSLVAERTNGKGKGVADQYAALPRVPDVQHMSEGDAGLALFFSLHRPLSISSLVPPPATTEAFHNIFESQQRPDPWADGDSANRRPEDVIYTLHNTIETLENASSSAQSDGLRRDVLSESPSNSQGVRHLDGAPRAKSIEELVQHFQPFKAPPPPQPFPDESKASEKKRSLRSAKQQASKPQQRRYQTTIEVLEVTDAHGQKTYTASPSPIIRLPDETDSTTASNAVQEPLTQTRIRQPFLERMRRRQQLYTVAQQNKIQDPSSTNATTGMVRRAPSQKRMKMFLISVKRQRKLKMKKHKYKKLMKRTRNLRRRLDRS